MLRAAANDAELLTLEYAGFGVSHDALGAALCESWGLAPASVASVRHHVQFQANGELPRQLPRPTVCALSAVAHVVMQSPEMIEPVSQKVAPQAQLDPLLVQRAALRVREQLDEAVATLR